MIKYKNIDLRDATVFDFGLSKETLEDEFGLDEDSKKDYIENLSIQTRVRDLLDVADLLGDKDLEEAISKEFESELSSFGFE